MKKILFTLVIALFAAAIFACQQEPVFLAEVTYPAQASGDAMLVDAFDHEFTFSIQTDGKWRVESDRRFLHLSPKEGSGNATVTVRVENNQGDERKIGNITIKFPGHEDRNKTLVIEQKFTGDYSQNAADILETTNKIYAVGYSYDCTGEYASPSSVKNEIFDTKALIKDGVLAVNAVQASLTSTTVSGSSISEMTNDLAVKANVSGGFGKFKAEANASFDMSHVKNSNYEFASTYFDLIVRRASLSRSLEALKDDYMTDDAWNDINGVPVKNKHGITKVRYPSKGGLKALVEQYGTHVVVESGLGGRICYSMEVDISKIKTSYDINAFAKASYDGIVKAGGSVDEKYHQSYQNNKQNISLKLNVLGGDEKLTKKLGIQDGFTKANLEAWMASVTENNMALVSFSNKSLVPIYELVERNATLEENGFDGEARYQELKNYIDYGCKDDFPEYDCGTVTMFLTSAISFNSNEYNSTLIKDIMLDGQYVGQICEEYVPVINREQRVTIVYPVLDNKPRYNMGFFLGNDSHKPARISWEGADVHIVEYPDLQFGEIETLYLRGASIKPTVPAGTEYKKATAIQDEYLDGQNYNKKESKWQAYKYPLVKIFDNVWTRQDFNLLTENNYRRELDNDCFIDYEGNAITPSDEIMKWRVYYLDVTVSHLRNKDAGYRAPEGWRIAQGADFDTMKSKLSANGWSYPGIALQIGQVTGFDVVWAGSFDTTKLYLGIERAYVPNKEEMTYVTSDFRRTTISRNGNISIDQSPRNGNTINVNCIRLVKE